MIEFEWAIYRIIIHVHLAILIMHVIFHSINNMAQPYSIACLNTGSHTIRLFFVDGTLKFYSRHGQMVKYYPLAGSSTGHSI